MRAPRPGRVAAHSSIVSGRQPRAVPRALLDLAQVQVPARSVGRVELAGALVAVLAAWPVGLSVGVDQLAELALGSLPTDA